MIDILTDVFITVSGLAALFFVVGYGLAAPWWRSDTGRHFFSFGLLIFAFCCLALATTFLGQDYYGRPVVRLIFWATLSFVLIWRNRVFVSAQLRRSIDSGSEDGNREESVLREKRRMGAGEGTSAGS